MPSLLLQWLAEPQQHGGIELYSQLAAGFLLDLVFLLVNFKAAMCKEKKNKLFFTCHIFPRSERLESKTLPGAQQKKIALQKGKCFISFTKTGKYNAPLNNRLIMPAKPRNS